MHTLKEHYNTKVIPGMIQKFGYTNAMAVARIQKVVVHIGLGKMLGGKGGDEQKKILEEAKEVLGLISGQKPAVTSAKKSIAGFKLRKGSPQGVKVTLRRKKMYDFLERFLAIVLPRTPDFRGIDRACVDGKGSLNIGMREHVFFPEILPETVKTLFGLQITITTNAENHERGFELLKLLGFPFKI